MTARDCLIPGGLKLNYFFIGVVAEVGNQKWRGEDEKARIDKELVNIVLQYRGAVADRGCRPGIGDRCAA